MKRQIFFIMFFMASVCNTKAQSDTTKYLFMGHIYYYFVSHARVDERVEKLDLKPYDGIWLGGDVCSEALLDYSTLEYIDGLFNLKHPNTHWALGNHDARNGNWKWLEELTEKKTYYTSNYKGISYMVLNPNITPYDCESLNDQYRILVDLCDTIQNSSHLILLMHHGLWKDVPGLPSPVTYAQSNLAYYSFTCDNSDATFAKDIYPRLVEVHKRGIEVICILGDMGGVKIDFLTEDQIHFLGCGITRSKYKDPDERANAPKDWILEFKHVPESGWLDWQFLDIDSVLAN
ncbi:MAG: metallophosphoesterase [Prolixibacteraceae bacterium]|jgi:hypothetical protein|nr:metallophosphoesterase [Prolixibacteraceae bacterium]MBT6998106.1 metallophosphoesterase [Prolixibacteraceae bacterium]MBT7396964.1 metallophosphoesterase [Prolixibacteraceae bacterium]